MPLDVTFLERNFKDKVIIFWKKVLKSLKGDGSLFGAPKKQLRQSKGLIENNRKMKSMYLGSLISGAIWEGLGGNKVDKVERQQMIKFKKGKFKT